MLHKKIYTVVNGVVYCFIFVGESNTGGNARNFKATDLEIEPNEFVVHLNNDTLKSETLKVSGEDANAQLGHCPRVDVANGYWHGWELEIGNLARQKFLGNADIYTLKAPQGGATVDVFLDESPYTAGGLCNVWCFQTFVDRFNAWLNYKPTNRDVKYVVLSSLGANDAKIETDVNVYKAKLTQIYQNVRDVIGEGDDVPIYATRFNQYEIPLIPTYNIALDEIEAADNYMHLVEMDGQELDTNEDPASHWTYPAVKYFANTALTHYKENYI